MPPIKASLLAHLRLLFCYRPSIAQVVESDEPGVRLQEPPTFDVASESAEPSASSATDVSATLAAPPTIEEAKASAKEHSRAFKAMVATFEGFTALAKFVEPFLEGTPFQAPAAVFIAVAEGVEKLKETKEGAENAMDSLSTRMRDVAQHYGDSRSAESRSMLEEYSKELVSAAQDIDAILKLSWLGQLRVDANKSRLEGVIDRIDKSTSRFQIRVVLAIERDTKGILDVLFKSNLRALNCAPSAQYKADTIEGQPAREVCTEGTRVDILQRIEDWAADPSSPSIFWLSGMAGSGKSTTAYTFCQRFSNGDASKAALGASFFCSRQVPELRRLGNIVPTLAYQLSHHSRSFATALKDVDLDVVNVSGEQVDKLLLAPWAASDSERSVDLPSTLIVIDALDEIDEDKGAELLQRLICVTTKLQQSQESSRKLKILVTSRPHPHIVNAGGQLGREAVYRLGSIEKSQGREDVLTFIRAKLHDIALGHDVLLERLADRTDGLFIYAATVVRMLSSAQPSLEMTRKEKLAWLSHFLDSPMTFSSDLDAVYDLYRTVLDKAIPERIRSRRLPILQRILCIQQPLTVGALSRMMDLDSDDEMDRDALVALINALHAVLYISDADGCVYVYHKSFADFMLDRQLLAHVFACDVNAQNAGIARACLRIMQVSLRFNICNLPSSYLLDSEVPNLAKSVKVNILDVPALEYACRYWISHTLKVPTSSQSARLLSEFLTVFVDEKVLFWLEVINLLRASANTTTHLKSISAWIKAQLDISTKLKSTLTAVERLAQSFFWTQTSSSTPHLYISCFATLLGMPYNLPSTWRTRLAKVPQILCTGTQSQGGLLTHMNVECIAICVAFSPDGTRIVSGSIQDLVRVWDTATGAELQKLGGHSYGARSVAFSPDGTRIVSSSYHSLRIWDVSTGAELQKLRGHTGDVSSVAFSLDGTRIASGSWDQSLRIWDASTDGELQKLQELDGHTGCVYSVAFSPDGTRIVSGSGDRSVRIWDTSTGAELHKLNGHTNAVNSVAFSPDGMRIVSGSDDRSVRIWLASTGEELHKLNGHTDDVNSVAFLPDGMRIVSGSRDKSLRIWNVIVAKLQTLYKHSSYVGSVAFSPDGTRVVSSSGDKSVRLWDASTGTNLHKLDGHPYSVYSAAFSPDGTRIVSGSSDGSVRIWEASTGAELRKLDGHTHIVRCVAFSPDGTRIVSGSWDYSVRIWDTSTGAERRNFDGHTNAVTSVAFSPDGTRIVSGSFDHSVRIWDASTGAELQRLDGHMSPVHSVALSPDGTRIVSGCEDGSVSIWDALTGAELHKLDKHMIYVRSVAFSPDGTRIVSGSDDKSILIWDALTGAKLQKLEGHKSLVRSVAFSPDGTRVVSGSGDESVRIWDALTGVELQKLDGHVGSVSSVAFSSDGTRIVSGSNDCSVRIWDVAAAHEQKASQWRLNRKTGWITSASSGNRLLWMPPRLHVGLYDGRACVLAINKAGSTRVDLSDACVGTEWGKCYQPS